MRVSCVAVVAALLLFGGSLQTYGQTPPAGGGAPPAPGQGAQAPAVPGQPATVPPATPGKPATGEATPAATPPLAARTFTAPAGLLFNAVRADRVADFEKVLAYLQAALEKASDPVIRAQAGSWKMFKAAEPGPGGTVLYVFAFDPAVPGADYGLGKILAEAYPDAAQLQEIWRLYQGAVTSGGSLLNLTPVTPSPGLPATVAPPSSVPPSEPALPAAPPAPG
jgi:hypothetical protein